MSDQTSDVPMRAPLDDLLEQARAMDWDVFAPPGAKDDTAAKRAATADYERVAMLAAALWQTDAFRAVVDEMCRMTLHRPTFLSPLQLPPKLGYAYGVFREGQNSVVAALLKMIAAGQGLKPEGREP